MSKLPIMAQDRPLEAVLSDCVHCGFCLPACPTYQVHGEEMDSPRGRIRLASLLLDGKAPLDAQMRNHFDNCLGCLGCVTACPSGVDYARILDAARQRVAKDAKRSVGDRVWRWVFLTVFPSRILMGLAARLLGLAQRTGLHGWLKRSGVAGRLPGPGADLVELAPDVRRTRSRRGLPRRRRPEGIRARVAVLDGCVQSAFFARTGIATRRVLEAEGFAVVEVGGQGCCGALEHHAGEEARARARLERLIPQFEAAEIDYVVVDAAGCGAMLKHAGQVFSLGHPMRSRAEAFSAKVRDALELLDAEPARARYRQRPLRVAYHDACHLSHGQGIREAPRRVLRRIPGLGIDEIRDGDLCCGSAGIYNLLEPETAAPLGADKAAAVAETGADVLAAANPGCSLQIQRYLEARGTRIRVVHPIELLAESLERGT